MASTVSFYKPLGSVLLGTGSASAGSKNITGWAGVTTVLNPVIKLRRVMIEITQAGNNAGRTWVTRVRTDDLAGNLTIDDACPFVGA